MTAIVKNKLTSSRQTVMKKYYRQIGLNIAYYRKLRGMSQMALAEATDLAGLIYPTSSTEHENESFSLESLLILQVFCRLHRAPCSISVMRNRRIFMNKS